MAYIDWMIKGPKIGSCNCSYGCPCEFNAPPTHEMCEGLEAHKITEGWFGDIRLDGLVIGARYRWPGPVHEGGGTAQGFIDGSASEAQVDALFKILSGEEQEPTTVFNIYGSTLDSEIDPVFSELEFACDLERRTGRFVVPGVLELNIDPIRNPVTGAEHFAQIVLPDGFEFRKAEMASGTFKAEGELAMEHTSVYANLYEIAYGPYGIIESK